MSIEIRREVMSDEAIVAEIKSDHLVVDTPHLGVNFAYDGGQIGTVLGELANRLVVVDTVRANSDPFGSVKDWSGHSMFSKRAGRDRLAFDTAAMTLAGVGSGQLGAKAWKILQDYENEDGIYNMVEFRLAVLRRVAGHDQVLSFSEYWMGMGDAAAAMQQSLAERGGFTRCYREHSIEDVSSVKDQGSILTEEGMYYYGEAGGLLPTTEALFAIFAVESAITDRRVLFHLCKASRGYVSNEFIKRVADLAELTLANLGINEIVEMKLIDRAEPDTSGSDSIYEMVEAA